MLVGEAFWPVVEELGNTFNMRVFWIDQFVTIEPEHVKVSTLYTQLVSFWSLTEKCVVHPLANSRN